MYQALQKNVDYWWLQLITGILIIILGLWCALTPWSTLVALSYFFAFTFIISGLTELFSISFDKEQWGLLLIGGLLDLILGIMVLSLPVVSKILVLAYLIGFWMLFRSLLALVLSLSLRKEQVSNWKIFLLLSILSLLLAVIFLISPVIASGFIVLLFSSSVIAYGCFRISLALELKKLKQAQQKGI